MRRRHWLHSTISAGVCAAVGTSLVAKDAAPSAANPGVPVIDTHTHFYDTQRPGGVPWPGKDDPVLYRPVLPAEFQKLTAQLGVVGTVVVEASPLFEDNRWLLDLAGKNPFLVGVIGNLAPGVPEFANRLMSLSPDRRYRGFRINHDRLKKGLSDPQFLKDLALVAELDLALDVNGGPEMPADVAALAGKLPTLTIMVNHLANVRHDGKGVPDSWRKGMEACSARERVAIKVSAMVEGTGLPAEKIPTTAEFYRPALDLVWKLFGEDRLVYGSNWPVSARYAPYDIVQKVAVEYFSNRGREAIAKFFSGNAQRLYRYPRG